MTLWFRVQPAKKSTPRIAVERMQPKTNEKGRVSYDYISLGGITDRKSPEEINEIIAKLDDEERYQLYNYLKNRTFNKENFATDMDKVIRENIYFPPDFHLALFELWKLAEKHNIPFSPTETALYAVLNKAKSVERNLNKILGKEVNILEKLGMKLDTIAEEELQNRIDTESRPLFKALTHLKQPIEKTCQEFISIAKKEYGKSADIKPHYLKKYIKSNQRLPKWYYSVAIDLLLKHGINPITIIPPKKVAEHWAQVRKANKSIEQVSQLFLETFKPDKKTIPAILETIKMQYERGIPAHQSAVIKTAK